MPNFTEPSWSVAPPPSNDWRLLEIKGGVEVASHALDQKCIVLGRAASELRGGITLAHESCSRLHARIAFDQQGTPWLRDLASAHGTSVNKRRLPPEACSKEEPTNGRRGSRGVVLYPGDVIQFGASTRMYCLEGPPEFERGAIKLRKQVEQAASTMSVRGSDVRKDTANASKQKNTADTNTDFSWGMGDTDDATDDSNISSTISHDKQQHEQQTTLDPSKIPEKHRKLFERLTAKQYKLQNVQLESQRIQHKGDLSQGQEAQLRKNEERIQKWQAEIDALEQELHAKIFPEHYQLKRPRKQVTNSSITEEEDDDCDFYDRTKDTHQDLFEDGETQESLVKKWKELVEEWNHCNKTLLHAQQTMSRLEQRLVVADEEDAFFLQNDVDLQKDSLAKAQGRREELVTNFNEMERLLKVVNPKIQFDRETGSIGEPNDDREKDDPKETASNEEPDDAAMMPPPISASSPLAPPRTLSPAASAMPPPFQMPPPMSMPPPQILPTRQDASVHSPAAKRPRVLGPTMPPPSAVGTAGMAVDEMEMPPPPQGRSPSPLPARRAPPIGTLSVLAGASSSSKRKQDHSSSVPKQPKEKRNDNGFDSKKDVWKAPKDQDGSGITKLNAKFAGRY